MELSNTSSTQKPRKYTTNNSILCVFLSVVYKYNICFTNHNFTMYINRRQIQLFKTLSFLSFFFAFVGSSRSSHVTSVHVFACCVCFTKWLRNPEWHRDPLEGHLPSLKLTATAKWWLEDNFGDYCSFPSYAPEHFNSWMKFRRANSLLVSGNVFRYCYNEKLSKMGSYFSWLGSKPPV